jgi:hypothetical protein
MFVASIPLIVRHAVLNEANPIPGFVNINQPFNRFGLVIGNTYGTILVDLEQSRPIEELKDRSSETLSAWLQAPSGVKSAIIQLLKRLSYSSLP